MTECFNRVEIFRVSETASNEALNEALNETIEDGKKYWDVLKSLI